MDEPCSALDPIATGRIEDLMQELKSAVHDRDRHPQHAAGGPGQRPHRVLHRRGRPRERPPHRRARRVRPTPRRSSRTRPTSAPRTTSPAGSAEPMTRRRDAPQPFHQQLDDDPRRDRPARRRWSPSRSPGPPRCCSTSDLDGRRRPDPSPTTTSTAAAASSSKSAATSVLALQRRWPATSAHHDGHPDDRPRSSAPRDLVRQHRQGAPVASTAATSTPSCGGSSRR